MRVCFKKKTILLLESPCLFMHTYYICTPIVCVCSLGAHHITHWLVIWMGTWVIRLECRRHEVQSQLEVQTSIGFFFNFTACGGKKWWVLYGGQWRAGQGGAVWWMVIRPWPGQPWCMAMQTGNTLTKYVRRGYKIHKYTSDPVPLFSVISL